MTKYSGLTKTSTALPRLAVLFVLSAASSPCPDLNLIHYKNHLSAVIPTDAKACLFESRIILHRHSRAGGNLVRSVSVIYDKFLLLFISRFPLSRE